MAPTVGPQVFRHPIAAHALCFGAEANWAGLLLNDQSVSLRVRSPHAFDFLAMFGGVLLEFVGQNLRTLV
jgi:hypothetical protein